MIHLINAELIAAGLSPLAPARAALVAVRLMLAEIDRLAAEREDFAFESTLSGRVYVNRLKRMKAKGYRIEIVYLRVASPALALKRIAARVRQGGHPVPKSDVLRRFTRSWRNFDTVYRPLADACAVYENSDVDSRLLEQGP